MSGSVVRPLPARPDLESERKRAKQLLREVRRGDAAALARVVAQNRSLDSAAPATIKLADAQLAIAREYGFRSWPLLIRYYETFDRHLRSGLRRHQYRSEFYKSHPEGLLREHAARRHWAGVSLGAFVPRFYGSSLDEIFAAEVTLSDARLASARQHGYTDWDEMLADADRLVPPRGTDADKPRRALSSALRERDLNRLQQLVQEHPELLGHDRQGEAILADAALYHVFGQSDQGSRSILEWIQSLGIDLQVALNRKLLGGIRMSTEAVDRLLTMGADPAWVAPNGYSVLEHAIHRYWNGEAVDRIAARVTPPDTFWVAAGLGDVKRLRRFFDRKGRLMNAARETRPDLMALGGPGVPVMPEADDTTLLWEAAVVATMNGRWAALDVLVEHGYPLDYNPGMTLLGFAVGNVMPDSVAELIARGASQHVRGYRPTATPLELAADHYASRPDDDARRILELCGGDPISVLAAAEARREPPKASQSVEQACAWASADALTQGRGMVGIENMAIALLREPTEMDFVAFEQGGTSVDRVRTVCQSRLDSMLEAGPTLLADDALRQSIDSAVAAVAARRESRVVSWDIWPELLAHDEGEAAALVRRAGGDPVKVRERYLSMHASHPRPPFR
jgi:hypothetical protein